ncbi:response regulator transcription factor [Pseudactinotalea sp. Z1739]|uniref:response regulator transcription factor n=1 Tax=Pseudactinotalea sp. Z1739 TaxID=3413028 RepID=UPI003C7B3AE6
MIRVLVVDDDAMVRQLLRTIIEQADLSVVADVGDGDEVIPAVHKHHPDVVVMDLRMHRVSGVEATRSVMALPDPPGVIALTSFDSEDVILEAVHAGAHGFLAKDADPAEIITAIRSVAAGDGALSPRAARTVMTHVQADTSGQKRREARERVERLTDREQTITTAVAAGLTNAQIARQNYLSEATVKTHLTNAMTKLDAANRVQVALVIDRAASGRSHG